MLLDEDYSILVGNVKLKLEKSKLDINGNPTYRLYVVDSEFIPLYLVTNNYAEESFYKITSYHVTDSLNTYLTSCWKNKTFKSNKRLLLPGNLFLII